MLPEAVRPTRRSAGTAASLPGPAVQVGTWRLGLALAATLGLTSCHRTHGIVVRAEPGGPRAESSGPRRSSLQSLLDDLHDPARVELPAGTYTCEPQGFVEPGCSTCTNPHLAVHASRGLRISGRGVHVVAAAGSGTVTIDTQSGYGVLFDHCTDCTLEGVTLTGGTRDADANAMDAAIVCVHSTVAIRHCTLSGNFGAPRPRAPPDAGVSGLVSRDASAVSVTDCQVEGCSRDGIAVFNTATAQVLRTVVSAGRRLHDPKALPAGRGCGLTVAPGGALTAEGCLVSGWLHGARVQGSATLELRHDILENLTAIGVDVNDLGDGLPVATVEECVIFRTGACGARILRAAAGTPERPAGSVRANAFVMTGQNPVLDSPDMFCHQVALDAKKAPQGMALDENLFAFNREDAGAKGSADATPEAFRLAAAPLLESLAQQPALAGSEFLSDFMRH